MEKQTNSLSIKKDTRALFEAFANKRTIQHPTTTENFFIKTNEIYGPYKDDPSLDLLIRSLLKHCEPLLPMASKQYKTQGNNIMPILIINNHSHEDIAFELAHDGVHFSGHVVHYLFHQLHRNL